MKLIKKTKSVEKAEEKAIVEETKPKYTDLRQVMDYTKPLSIFFSGVEYESYLEILYNLGIRNFLMSYEYLKGKGLAQLKKFPDIRLFIDSGAFTYMSDPKFESYTVEQWEEQINLYLKWAEKHRNQIFAICELDLQYLVGLEKVQEWRRKFFEPFMLRTGIPVCFMYHEEDLAIWENMCQRYPYVGMSLRVDEDAFNDTLFRDMFRIAEKHNALVQGMASTKTSLLTQLPFYTVDSTTWNVGLKYGEISVWNSTKMSRIKKEDFTTKAFPIIDKYDVKFDHDLILAEDKTEMIRVNAYAFVMAEKYIRERLKSSMYWFKARTVKQDVTNLGSDFFPSVEWFEGDLAELSDYCRKCNINPELPNAGDILYDMTAFMNWDNPSYSKMRDWYLQPDNKSIITDLHEVFVNRIVSSDEERVADLVEFYKSCISGENDKLLQLGTDFDRTVKERDKYIEEDDTELVEMTQDEIKERLSKLLPDKSFEADDGSDIMALDAEIYKQADIVPTYDEKGRFVKGCKHVKAPKKVYSKKYPKLACDTCMAAAKCPEYKSGYVCAYNKMFDRFSCRDMGDIIQSVQGIVEHNMTRMQKSMIMETINGTIDPVTTQLMDQNIRYMNMLKQMYECGSPEVLRQTKVLRADGSEETTVSVTNPQSGGIMEKLFGSMMNSNKEEPEDKKEDKEIIEVNADESKQSTTDN